MFLSPLDFLVDQIFIAACHLKLHCGYNWNLFVQHWLQIGLKAIKTLTWKVIIGSFSNAKAQCSCELTFSSSIATFVINLALLLVGNLFNETMQLFLSKIGLGKRVKIIALAKKGTPLRLTVGNDVARGRTDPSDHTKSKIFKCGFVCENGPFILVIRRFPPPGCCRQPIEIVHLPINQARLRARAPRGYGGRK